MAVKGPQEAILLVVRSQQVIFSAANRRRVRFPLLPLITAFRALHQVVESLLRCSPATAEELLELLRR